MNYKKRRLTWSNTLNTRELGGYPTANGQIVGWQQLIRSDNLSRLTADGQDALVNYGIRSIIDLRCPWELEIDPPPFTNQKPNSGLPTYYNLPLIDEDNQAHKAAADKLETMLDSYCLRLQDFQKEIALVFSTIANAPEGGVLFYCHAGKDRTGMIAALLLAVLGVSPEDVSADYAESRGNLQPLLNQWLANIGDDLEKEEMLRRDMAADPDTMLGVLAFLGEEYGGEEYSSVESYLLKSGVLPSELDALRTRLLV